MRDNLPGAVWRFAIFAVVCVLALFVLLLVFARLRFQQETVFRAQFSNVSGLKQDQFVRVAGVEVGKVKRISLQPDATVLVEFAIDPSVILTKGSDAVIRYDNLIGDRYLALEQGAGATDKLAPGATIPLARTAPALDLDALIGGFRPLFRALDPDQVNALTGQLIAAFQGQGATISSFLAKTASFTNTLADRDQLIGEVVNNLNVVLGSLGDQSKQFEKAVTSLSDLVKGLAARKADIGTGLAYVNEGARSVADLLSQARSPLHEVVAQTDRAAGTVVADHNYVDTILNTLPDKYKLLSRQGLYGDFFSFYLCDAYLKVNGKGGQPVYIKVAGQDTGRCAPR
ncbi:MCE family protein [Mycobacterium sp.]|uniref:MCE family protein n=1 Tax=Mycobacterium sp. TaxID=1785 RepID=UPI003D0E0F8D